MATENLQIPDIASNQNQKEVTANAAHNLLDRAMNNNVQKAITVATSFTTTEARENFVIELTGTPGGPINIDMPDTNNRTLAVVNNTDDVMTIRNSASGGTGQPVISVGEASIFQYDGVNFFDLTVLAVAASNWISLTDTPSVYTNFGGQQITVDAAETGVEFTAQHAKIPVRLATTVAGTLASDFENTDSIDGVALVTGDRILIKDQSTGSENGVYTVEATGAPTRAIDFDDNADVILGETIPVLLGNVNAKTIWMHTAGTDIGTDTLTFLKTIPEGVYASNVIINGNFDIWQRGTTFTGISSGDYGPDRFQWIAVGSGVVDFLRSTFVPDNESDFSLQVDVTTADGTIAAGDIYTIRYKVEGYDAMRFAFGTSDAKNLTLSFWVSSSKTGIHCVSFQNSAANRSYVIEYTIDSADTLEYKTVTLAADTAGTWLTDNGIGVSISWALAAGTDFQGVADTWNAADDIATSNQVNVMDNVANNFHISRVHLEPGSVATDFERRPFAAELAMCQRYFFKTFPQGVAPAQNAGLPGVEICVASGTLGGQAIVLSPQYPVTMRVDPTVTTYNPSAANADVRNIEASADETVLISGTVGDDRHVYITTTTAVVDGERHAIHVTAEAEL